MTVGEAFGVAFDQAPLFTDARRHELSMIFHFDIVRIDHDNWRKIDRTLPRLKATYTKIDRAAGEYGWNTSFLGNHDNPRAVSHFGDDSAEWRVRSAKALATLTLTQRATPFLYQGDELGMTNYPFQSIDEFDDVEVKGLWRTLVETGQVPAEELLRNLRQTSRDHSRTPMQWSDRGQRRLQHRPSLAGGQPQLPTDQRGVPGRRPGFGVQPPPPADRVAAPDARADPRHVPGHRSRRTSRCSATPARSAMSPCWC